MAEDEQQVATSAEQGDSNETAVAQGEQNGEVNGQEEPQQNRLGFWNIAKTLIVRCIFIYMITSFFRKPATPPQPAGQAGADAPAGSAPGIGPAQNIYIKDLTLDMYVFVNEQEKFTNFGDRKSLFWLEEELAYGDWLSGVNGDGSYEKNGQLPISESVQNNGSLYIHVYFVRAGNSPDPKAENYEKKTTVHQWKRLNRYKKRHYHSSTNLLTGETSAHPDLIKKANETKMEILSFWHPNLTINLIEDYTPWMPGAVPAPINEFVSFVDGGKHYSPILYLNDYWNLNSEMTPINDTTPILNLTLTYSPMSLFKWQMYAAQTMRSKWYSAFLGEDFMEESDEDQDSLKTTFLETSPYLLGLTIVISIVHSVFEFLAFKNDIQFWRNRKSLEGLSVRSVIFGVFQSLIVVLYVMDNETNFVVRCSVCVGLVIEIWKIFKVIDVTLDRENPWFGVIPRVMFNDKSTYVDSSTREYDRMAFKYLSWVLYPLLVCYAVYSMLYLEHKGWYSFVLSLLYGFLLTFGFIMMTPQLFINYKLKSVAHLPWRMLTYKALNTFIDDLFAFVIKMPTLYRIGCLRDDVIFLIYLYQRYIYRVDPKRVNEFGTSQEMMDEPVNGELPPGEATPAIEGADNKKQDKAKKEKNSPKSPPKPKNKKAKKED